MTFVAEAASCGTKSVERRQQAPAYLVDRAKGY